MIGSFYGNIEKKNRLYAGKPQEMEVLIMRQSEILTGNQQERLELRSCKLAYLAGFYDADGCISLYKTCRRKGSKVYLRPQVSCTNCDFDQIDSICEIMDFLKFPYHILSRKATKFNHRPSKDIRTIGVKRCARILPQLIPYLIGKKERASFLLWFCKLRLVKIGKAEPYMPVEIAIYDEIHEQNRRGSIPESSETNTPISLVNITEDEDRVRACVRA